MKELVCIVCPKGCYLQIEGSGPYQISGQSCDKGESYALAELTNPTRVLPSTVRVRGGLYPRLPVKTSGPIPKALLLEAARLLDGVEVQAPVQCGDVILQDILGTGVDFVATRDL